MKIDFGIPSRASTRSVCRSNIIVILSCALLLLNGCALHQLKDAPAPLRTSDAFPLAQPSRAAQESVAWWHEFADDQLDLLIKEVLNKSLTVSEAASRVLQARSIARQAGAERWPQLDAVGAAGYVAENERGFEGAVNQAEFENEAGLVIGWEVDVFRRLQSRREAAVRDAVAAADDLEAVRLTLAAEVAANYYQAIEQRLLLKLLSEQIELDKTLLELTELRYVLGGFSSVDVLRQRAQLADSRALIPPTRAALRRAENQLDVLLGRPVDGASRAKNDLPAFPDVVAVGVPADLVIKRPDLRSAQRQLEAIDFRIAEAIADRLPRVTLTGELGYAEGPDGSGTLASLLAGLTAPIFDAGRRSAVVDQRRAEYAAQLANFSQLYLQAISDVDGLLYEEIQQRERVRILAERIGLLEESLVEVRNRYANGIDDYLSVLTTLEELQETQRESLNARQLQVQLRIDLYRAIGGTMPSSLSTP